MALRLFAAKRGLRLVHGRILHMLTAFDVGVAVLVLISAILVVLAGLYQGLMVNGFALPVVKDALALFR